MLCFCFTKLDQENFRSPLESIGRCEIQRGTLSLKSRHGSGLGSETADGNGAAV